MKKVMYILVGMIFVLSLAACAKKRKESSDSETASGKYSYNSVFPQHEPYGAGIGAMPGRVVWM